MSGRVKEEIVGERKAGGGENGTVWKGKLEDIKQRVRGKRKEEQKEVARI